MNQTALFFKKFLRHGTQIASAVPSSRWLSRQTISNVDWAQAKVVVELGAGTGAITDIILAAAPADCKILSFESDADFARVLRKRFANNKNLQIIEGNACTFDQELVKQGIAKADYIVSGLGVPSLSPQNQSLLFAAVAAKLSPQGSYNQITEFPLIFLSFYKRHFKDVRFIFEPRNIPPGGVYICKTPVESK